MTKIKKEVLEKSFESFKSMSKSQKKEPEIEPKPSQPELTPPSEPEINPLPLPDKEPAPEFPEIEPKTNGFEIESEIGKMLIDIYSAEC